jgi:4,5-dihydroxyphthalate decarboxylase
LQIGEIFFRFPNYREYDLSEISVAKYASLISQGDESLTAIPVFPMRIVRHSSIYVRPDEPVQKPADLKGRRVGVPEWAQTAAVYSRGFLVHQYGMDLSSIEWIQAGVDQEGRSGWNGTSEQIPSDLPGYWRRHASKVDDAQHGKSQR